MSCQSGLQQYLCELDLNIVILLHRGSIAPNKCKNLETKKVKKQCWFEFKSKKESRAVCVECLAVFCKAATDGVFFRLQHNYQLFWSAGFERDNKTN